MARATRSARTFRTCSSFTGSCGNPARRSHSKSCSTIPASAPWHGPTLGESYCRDTVTVLGLATGYGLDNNVLTAYDFLINHYQEGDDIFLFGFSRGAYTIRVLAGLIHKIGLLSPQQRNLAGAGLTAYKQFATNGKRGQDFEPDPQPLAADAKETEQGGPATRADRAAQFARIVSTKWPTIKFVGVWDTVASVIVPRPDRCYLPSLLSLPYTRTNPSVKAFRQAIAIDERRRMFRLNVWKEPQIFRHNRFSKTNNEEPQDSLQVWFAGVHSDIGGGYPEKESGLSKYPLVWMIEEAMKFGLAVDQRTVNQLAWGVQRKGSPFSYVGPDFMRDPHDSMTAGWRILEFLPKTNKYKEWKARQSFLGCYLPTCEPRPIPESAFIHESVFTRMEKVPKYRPINLPDCYETIPLSPPPRAEKTPKAENLDA